MSLGEEWNRVLKFEHDSWPIFMPRKRIYRNRSSDLTVGITGALRCAIILTSLGRYTCSRLIHTRRAVYVVATVALFLRVARISRGNLSFHRINVVYFSDGNSLDSAKQERSVSVRMVDETVELIGDIHSWGPFLSIDNLINWKFSSRIGFELMI